jgi:hypothetical protein
MNHPNRMERDALVAEVRQLRAQLARTVPVIEAAVALQAANRGRDEARTEAAVADLCDATEQLLIGTLAHATAVKLGVAE